MILQKKETNFRTLARETGSAFIGYAMILLLMLRVGAGFLARKRVSQEYLDSWVIMLWGIVNTFTEHNFLAAHPTGWSHKDMVSFLRTPAARGIPRDFRFRDSRVYC
jgi:hypothetical protein